MNDTVFFSPFLFAGVYILAYLGTKFFNFCTRFYDNWQKMKPKQEIKQKEGDVFENDLIRFQSTKVFLVYFDYFQSLFTPEYAFWRAIGQVEELLKNNQLTEKYNLLKQNGINGEFFSTSAV